MRLLTSLLVIAVLAGVGLASAQPPAGPSTPEAIVYALLSRDPVTRKAAEAAAVQTGAPMVEPLCRLMSADSSRRISVAEKVLFAIAAEASRPDGEARRVAVAKALAGEARNAASDRARAYATQLLGICGGDEVMPALKAALNDPATSGAAVAALQRLPAHTRASEVLGWVIVGRLLSPGDPDPALLSALGARRDAAWQHVLEPAAYSREVATAVAALDALGSTGDPRVAPAVAEVLSHRQGEVQAAACRAMIALADAEQQRGGPFARRCYRKACDYAVTPAQKTAALMGLADTDPSMRVQWLLKGMGEAHTRPVAYAELLKVDAAQLAGPLRQRLTEAQGEELDALQALAAAKEISAGQ
jgi:hypothetical protein